MKLLTLLLFIPSVGFADGIYDPSHQKWQVDGVFAQILGESPDLFPELAIQNYQGANALDVAATSCIAHVLRPGYLVQPEASVQNSLTCSLHNLDGSTGTLSFDLAEVPFEAWGNRPSENHWHRNGLAKPFQIHFTEGFGADINMRLARAMSRREAAGDPYVSSNYICGPYGVLCSGWVSLDVDPEDPYSSSHLICTVDTESEVIYKTRCVFHFPSQVGK